MSIEDLTRLLSKAKRNTINNCLEFTGSLNNGGYGTISFRKKIWKAHRMSWVLTKGEIPNGKFVLHKCDNPKCIDPKHLFLGTQAENIIDCKNKKRWGLPKPTFGTQNHFAKINPKIVLKMRLIRKKNKLSYKKIGELFNISTMTAFRAIKGESWKQIFK